MYDVIIIGGSYAGLSAAMALCRSLRNVLIIDSGKPCNQQTPHSHNFLTQDGETPHTIAQKAKEQVLSYSSVTFIKDSVSDVKKLDGSFLVLTELEKKYASKKLIIASGIKDIMPDIDGFSSCWGISVIHCPYCHGYEVRNKKTGILANGEIAFHYAKLLINLTKELTIFTNGNPNFTDEQLKGFAKHKIAIIDTKLVLIGHTDGYLNQLIFEDNSKLELDAVYSRTLFEQNKEIVSSLGLALTDNGFIKVDTQQKTNVEGVFACGDNSSPMRSVAAAVASGNMAGAMVNHQLVDEEFNVSAHN